MKNIVVLVSGGGTNLQALIDAQNRGEIANGRISCVISSKEGVAHEGSFRALLGDRYEAEKEKLSLEDRVGEETPPCFLWHTFADATVPVENSLLMAGALHRCHVKTELHIFQEGVHGLGAADELSRRADGSGVQRECQCWTDLAYSWMEHIRHQDEK